VAHFAEIDKNNIVNRVIGINNDVITDKNGNENEQMGIDFCKFLYGSDTNWVQTSYNANFRNIYAVKGCIYDEDLDAFILSQPYPSWTFNIQTLEWDPPISEPKLTPENISKREFYQWNEENQRWDFEESNSPLP
jgi:hypothetical protein